MESTEKLPPPAGRHLRRVLVETEILEKAARLFAQRGFAATSLEQVASELGLQRSSLYHYFPSKEELLARLVTSLLSRSEAALKRIRAARGEGPVVRLEVIVEALLEPIIEAPNRFKLLLTAQTDLPLPLEGRWHEVRQALVAEVRDAIREGARSGQFRVVDLDAATFTLLGMCNWVAWWPAARRQDPAVVAQQIAQVAVGGLGQPRPPEVGDSPPDAIAGIRAHLDRLETQLKGEKKGTMTSIHVTRWGTSGPQVLMIHGGPQGGPGGGAQIFAGQRPLADRGWRLVLPDRPGHGQSPSRGPEDMEKDAVWVAEMLGDGSHLLGHSYGALVALAAAGLRPGAVRSLTLVEAPLLAAAPDHPDVKGFVAEQVRIETSDLDPLPRLMQFSALIGIPIDLLPPPSIEHLEAMAEGLASMRSPADWDGAVPLAAVATAGIPTLAITGAGAPAFGAMADGIATASGGEHRVIHAGHHFPQLLAGEFNDVLDAFMREAESNFQQ